MSEIDRLASLPGLARALEDYDDTEQIATQRVTLF